MAIIETALTRLLGIDHPILLAPMGSAAGGKLAAAVTNAGGLGMVGSGYADADTVRKELAEAGNARVGVGFILWALEKNPSALEVALDARPAAVMLSFGDPTQFYRSDQGSRMQDHLSGANARTGQGSRCRGCRCHHRARTRCRRPLGMTRGTMGLVPAVVDAVAPIPVVAAGGIADGRGLAAALALGAAGVSMGTRFTASRESLWAPAMQAATLAASGDQTEQTRVFDVVRGAPWPAIYPGRALRNSFSAQWHGREEALVDVRQVQEEAYLATGPTILTHAWSGLVRAWTWLTTPPAAEIIERIIAQAVATLMQARNW